MSAESTRGKGRGKGKGKFRARPRRWYGRCTGPGTMSYVGPERRIHKVYVTRNTEYHVRRNVCVDVRDRTTGQRIVQHRAIGLELTGAVRTGADDGPVVVPRMPVVGERLCLGDMRLVTSTLEEIRRPPREVVVGYPAERRA